MLSSTLPLITANSAAEEVHLILGTNNSSTLQKRIRVLLDSGAQTIVIGSNETVQKQLNAKFSDANIRFIKKDYELSDLTTLGRIEVGKIVDRVFIFDTNYTKIQQIHNQCRKLRIPINTFQRPEYSTFNLTSTYRDPENSGLQISVSTNGQGCLLSNRIKREIVNKLPPNVSDVVKNTGYLRSQIIEKDMIDSINNRDKLVNYGLCSDDDLWESHNFNNLVKEFEQTKIDSKFKKTRWLSQIMEYYPFAQLSKITIDDFNEYMIDNHTFTETTNKRQKIYNSEGSISLVGSGPGSVSMLTIGALDEIKNADLILADKLVPESVMDLIPKTTETCIAKKFPGNAEQAQQEFLTKGLDALKQGLKVVRLKQGDPYIFGRGGEEFLFFKENGYTPHVLPGLSSALASTVVSDIPATQRDIADQILICTGTGRKGSLPTPPEYVESRTTVFLMALHRAEVLTKSLIENKWDENVPVAIVERASCVDQRVTRTLLKYLPEVVKEIGSRPPGLLITGHAVMALTKDEFNDNCKYKSSEGYREFDISLENIVNTI